MILLCVASIVTIVSFAYKLYCYEKPTRNYDKSHCLPPGEYTGFSDYYACEPIDIIVLENELGVKETICLNL